MLIVFSFLISTQGWIWIICFEPAAAKKLPLMLNFAVATANLHFPIGWDKPVDHARAAGELTTRFGALN